MAEDMTDSPDVIALLEAATGPSRKLDAEIAVAIAYDREDAFGRKLCDVIERLGVQAFTESDWQTWQLPRWTDSVDSALSLVPRHPDGNPWCTLLEIYADGRGNASIIPPIGNQIYAKTQASPPIALCVAALLARKVGAQ